MEWNGVMDDGMMNNGMDGMRMEWSGWNEWSGMEWNGVDGMSGVMMDMDDD